MEKKDGADVCVFFFVVTIPIPSSFRLTERPSLAGVVGCLGRSVRIQHTRRSVRCGCTGHLLLLVSFIAAHVPTATNDVHTKMLILLPTTTQGLLDGLTPKGARSEYTLGSKESLRGGLLTDSLRSPASGHPTGIFLYPQV